jgi:RNA polymerase sigma-70 factor (ECF subfamily)
VSHHHERAAQEITPLYETVAPRLFVRALVLAQGHRQKAEDLVQDVFHDAIKQWKDVRGYPADRQERWLYRVLHNKTVDMWRGGRRLIALPEEAAMPSERDVHHEALCRVAVERVWKCLQSMPPSRHHVACLRWIAGWETSEIAQRLGISPSTVRVHLKYARDVLRRELGPDVPFIDDLDYDEQQPGTGGAA